MNKTIFGFVAAACLVVAAGCQPSVTGSEKWLLPSFEEGTPITYQFTSERNTIIDLTTGDPAKKSKPQTTTEKLNMVMTYTPVDVDPFGLTTVRAECKKAVVTRTSFTPQKSQQQDAIETLTGKSFTLTLSPTGQLVDTRDLERILLELGKAAFSTDSKQGRIKNPDMISDFLAIQWHFWDLTSTIADPMRLHVGNSWKTEQMIPWPLPLKRPPGRVTTFTLEKITSGQEGPAEAFVKSDYALSKNWIESIPYPYESGFQLRGLYGFLRNYRFRTLEGSGQQVFNLDQGCLESGAQQYSTVVDADFMMPLGDSKPILTVTQTIRIQRIESP